MSNINPTDEWFTGEHNQQSGQVAAASARPKERVAPGKRSLPAATQRAVDDINARYPGGLDDALPADL